MDIPLILAAPPAALGGAVTERSGSDPAPDEAGPFLILLALLQAASAPRAEAVGQAIPEGGAPNAPDASPVVLAPQGHAEAAPAQKTLIDASVWKPPTVGEGLAILRAAGPQPTAGLAVSSHATVAEPPPPTLAPPTAAPVALAGSAPEADDTPPPSSPAPGGSGGNPAALVRFAPAMVEPLTVQPPQVLRPGVDAPSADRPADLPALDALAAGPKGERVESTTLAAPRHAPETAAPRPIAETVVHGVRYALLDGGRTVTIRLVPSTLGELRVDVSATPQGNVSIHLTATTDMARDAIQTHLVGIREALSAQGLDVARVTVAQDALSGQSPHQGHPHGAFRGDLPAHPGRSAPDPGQDAGPGVGPAPSDRPHAGFLNVTV